jgi:hypothetical protein
MVTLAAWMVMVPVTSRASMTVPGVVTVNEVRGVRVVPSGTPVFDAFGNPTVDGGAVVVVVGGAVVGGAVVVVGVGVPVVTMAST